MVIGIDIDDTLTDSFSYFQPYVAEYFDVDLYELKRKNISYFNLPYEWKKDELGFCRTYYDKIVTNTPFKKDAALGVKRLRELGHRIIIITGRTKKFYTDPYKTTEEELASGGIVYDKLICTLDKAEACVNENISVIIDDLPEHCAAASKSGILAILFNSPANMNINTDFKRVSDWDAAVEAIVSLEKDYSGLLK